MEEWKNGRRKSWNHGIMEKCPISNVKCKM
jgi:hypothetical protein